MGGFTSIRGSSGIFPVFDSRMKVDHGVVSISCRHVVSGGYLRGRKASE